MAVTPKSLYTASNLTTTGIQLQQCGNVIVENNVINDTAPQNAVSYSGCGRVKPFNNQDTSGTLLRAYDGTQYTLELEDTVQDVLLPL